MDVTSTYKYARISARKARDVAREIQGLPVSDALDILNFTPRKGAQLFGKTMKTALADAENNFELSVEGLFVKSAVVGEGPTFKRFKPRARGSAAPIRKRTSHLTVVLSDEGGPTEKEPKRHLSAKSAKSAKAAKPSTKKSEAEATVAKEEPSARGAKASKSGRVVFSREIAVASERAVDEVRGMVYHSHPAGTDDLKLIDGIDVVLEEKLNALGIDRFAQIASWTGENVREFEKLLASAGRIGREEWVSQAAVRVGAKRGS